MHVMLSEPGVGHVLCGDAINAAAWLEDNHLVPRVIGADPWYGIGVTREDRADVNMWLRLLVSFDKPWLDPGTPVYFWGGMGKPHNRPLLQFILDLERETNWHVQEPCTWGKKRAYGKPDRYLQVKEECLVLLRAKAYRKFNVPYLDEVRGYTGYNKQYPAKDERKRRTNVWTDTEILQGKLHPCHKPPVLCRLPIEVHTEPNDLVLDLFAGSGELSVQAMRLNRSFVAVEKNMHTARKIAERIRTELDARQCGLA